MRWRDAPPQVHENPAQFEPKNSPFQFSLRHLLYLTTLICCATALSTMWPPDQIKAMPFWGGIFGVTVALIGGRSQRRYLGHVGVTLGVLWAWCVLEIIVLAHEPIILRYFLPLFAICLFSIGVMVQSKYDAVVRSVAGASFCMSLVTRLWLVVGHPSFYKSEAERVRYVAVLLLLLFVSIVPWLAVWLMQLVEDFRYLNAARLALARQFAFLRCPSTWRLCLMSVLGALIAIVVLTAIYLKDYG